MIQQCLTPQSYTFTLQQTYVLNFYRMPFCSHFLQNNLYNYILITSFKGFLLQNNELLKLNSLIQSSSHFFKNPSLFFPKQGLKTRRSTIFKNLRSLVNNKPNKNITFAQNSSSYFIYRYLGSYHTYFKTKSFPLLSPFIKKKNRHFLFVDNSFKSKTLNHLYIGKKFFKNRRHWFLTMINRTGINITVSSVNKIDTWVSRSLKTQRVKRKLGGKKRIYLFPRQHLLLNGSRTYLKKNKPFKTLLLKRLIKFYRRHLKRIGSFSTTQFKKVANKNYKSNFTKNKITRFSKFFKLTTLWHSDTIIKLNTSRIIRRGKSRKKLIRTRKYLTSYYRNLRQNHWTSVFATTIFSYYKFTRSRYLRRFIRKNTKRNKTNLVIKSLLASFKKTSSITTLNTNFTKTQLKSKKNGRKSVSFTFKKFSIFGPNHLLKSSPTFQPLTFKTLSTNFYNFFNQKKPLNNPTKPSILSKYKTPFILSNVGFLFIQPINTSINDLVKSKLNRFRYTFFYQNEVKRFFLRKPGNLKLSFSFLTSSRGSFLSHFSPYKFFNTNLLPTTNLQNNFVNLLTKQTQFFKYNYDRKYVASSYNFVKTQVSMRRIKFKPGYSRIWRKAREAVNKSLNYNSKYQYSLTRYLSRFSRASKKSQVQLSELTLQKLLINSKLIHDSNTSNLLITNGLVYVNGQQTLNVNMYLFQSDFIQIIVSLKYYIVHKWLLNWNSFKKIRLIKLSRNKLKKTKSNAHKQKSSNFPDWVLQSRIKPFDIPKYLEVDFFTLSTFVLYEPFLFNDFNPLNFIESRSTIFNMYNWKYIN